MRSQPQTDDFIAGLLSSFILISYFAMTSSMMLDLTELKNKVSKLKVNPRGNLWATGHFMGKKSVVDGSFLESAFEDVPAEVRVLGAWSGRVDDLLKAGRQTQHKQLVDILPEAALWRRLLVVLGPALRVLYPG
uniref:Neuromedin Bb n=1 Tax=Echeneis naucrates TaxID=173247 RepID=A0A665VD44_ECHNA